MKEVEAKQDKRTSNSNDRQSILGSLMVMNLARSLEHERIVRRLKKGDFCKRINVSQMYYSDIMHNKANPTIYMIARFAEALQLDPAILLGSKPYETTRKKDK